MTDEELIDGLRQNALWVTTHDAADRIEALVRERDATWNEAIKAAAKMADEGMDSHRAIAADIRTLLKP